MDHILEDYKKYYKARMQRYEGDSMFSLSYASEKDLYDCISSATSMAELMQTKATSFKKLVVKNGIALVKDQANYRLRFYQNEKEQIKANGQQEILEKINAATDAMQIASLASETQAKNDVEVVIDLLWPSFFFNDVIWRLENIEMEKNAIVPDNWKSEMKEMQDESIKSYMEGVKAFLTSIRNYQPDWQWNYAVLWEHRHRKKCPLPDHIIQQRIDEHKALCSSSFKN